MCGVLRGPTGEGTVACNKNFGVAVDNMKLTASGTLLLKFLNIGMVDATSATIPLATPLTSFRPVAVSLFLCCS